MEAEEIKTLLAMGAIGFSAIIVIFSIIKLIAKLFFRRDTISPDFLVFVIIAWVVISTIKKVSGNFCLATSIGAVIGYFILILYISGSKK